MPKIWEPQSMTWTEHAKHGNSASDVLKLIREKFVEITTDQRMEYAKTIKEVANVKSVNATVHSPQPLKPPHSTVTGQTIKPKTATCVDLLKITK